MVLKRMPYGEQTKGIQSFVAHKVIFIPLSTSYDLAKHPYYANHTNLSAILFLLDINLGGELHYFLDCTIFFLSNSQYVISCIFGGMKYGS